MTKKLKKLTAEQEDLISVVRDEWLNPIFGRDGPTPLDKEGCREGIEWLYELSDLEKPIIFFLDSPYACQLAANLVKKLFSFDQEEFIEQDMGQIKEKTEKEVHHQIKDILWSKVDYYLYDYVVEKIFSQIGGISFQIWDQIEIQIQDQIRDQVKNQVRNQFQNEFQDQGEDQIGFHFRNQTYDYFNDEIVKRVEFQPNNLVYNQICNQIFRTLGQFWNQIQEQMKDQIENYDYDPEVLVEISTQIFEQYWDHCRKQVGTIIENKLEYQLWVRLHQEIRSQVSSRIYPSRLPFQVHLENEINKDMELEYFVPAWRDFFYDGDFGAFYSYWSRIGVLEHGDYDKYFEYLRSYPGYTIFLKGFAFVCGLPSKIYLDSDDRLHSETGPALAWEDGYTQYYWHGVSVPGKWIDEPLSITGEDFLTEPNAERRRALHEILGTDRLTEILELETVDIKEVPFQTWDREAFLRACRSGELGEDMCTFTEDRILTEPEKILPFYDLFIKDEIQIVTLKRTKNKVDGESEAQFIEVQCPSTGEVFHLGVPEDFTDAAEARAWTLYEDEEPGGFET